VSELEAVERVLARARPVPLTSELRVERKPLRKALAGLRRAAPQAAEVADRFDRLVESARSVPLTGQARIDADELAAILEELRLAV
jgi:hypothetical protein